ncbi:MAG TPA: endonuclease/exonuclease/phosphatase family protein [Verrucomicrobiae bacterium]
MPLLTWVFAASALRAEVILSDGFIYPDGPITNASGSPWIAHSGSGTNDEALVVSEQLQLSSSRAEDVHAPLIGQPYLTNSGVVLYAGFTVNFTTLPNSGGGYFAHFNSSGSHRCVVWASTTNATPGMFRLSIGNTSGATSTNGQIATDLSSNTTYAVVTRYDTATGQSTIWLNPTTETDASVTATDAPSPVPISNYSFRQAAGIGTLAVDDLRVGTSFADVMGGTNSIPPPVPGMLSLLTYNVKGNGATNWSTNAPQVQAIGRQLMYLNPDIITFNEIPQTNMWEMTNWISAFLPGYHLASNSAGDGYIRNAIVSRFPILSSKSHLHGSDLSAYGYTNSDFTRDLFEAQISVPGFLKPLHVFAAHLKASSDIDSAAKRAAEASAVSNYLVTVFLASNTTDPYIMSGDLNEDINRPPGASQQPVQRLIAAPTGLQLTTPRNPLNGDDRTISIQSGLTERFDYILPGGLMFSNIATSQIFRTDVLNPTPTNLLQFDDVTASDHLPVMMTFSNPYATPFLLTSVGFGTQQFTLKWRATPGQVFYVQASTNLSNWAVVATNTATNSMNYTSIVVSPEPKKYFRVTQ